MKKFDLFCMIFLSLDADWDDTHNEELGRFLSDANPYLFEGNVSAVRYVYEDFCKYIGDKEISIENSFQIAKGYVEQLDIEVVSESFALLEEEQWKSGLAEYFASAQEGMDLDE